MARRLSGAPDPPAGVTGSGRSTLALALGVVLDLPVTLVDEAIWLPGWVSVPEAEQDVIAAGRIARDEWALDSTTGGTGSRPWTGPIW